MEFEDVTIFQLTANLEEIMVSELVHPPVQHEGKREIIQRDEVWFLFHDHFEKVEQGILLVVAFPPTEHLAKVVDDLPDVFTLNFTERDVEHGRGAVGLWRVVF